MVAACRHPHKAATAFLSCYRFGALAFGYGLRYGNGSHFGDGTGLGLRRKAGHADAVLCALRVICGKRLFMFLHRQSSAMARCVSGMVL